MFPRSRFLRPLLAAATLAVFGAGPATAHELCASDASHVEPGSIAPTYSYFHVVAGADVMGDSTLEIVFFDEQAHEVRVLPESGAPLVIDWPTGMPASAAAGDVNGDGERDLLLGGGDILVWLAPTGGFTGGSLDATDVDVHVRRDTTHPVPMHVGLGDRGALRVGDLDDDGVLDIAYGDWMAFRPFPVNGSTDTWRAGEAGVVFGSGTWTDGTPTLIDLAQPCAPGFRVHGATGSPSLHAGDELGSAIDVADVDGDGDQDLLVSVPNTLMPPFTTTSDRFGQVLVFYGPLPSCTAVDMQQPVTIPHVTITSTSGWDGFGTAIDVIDPPGTDTAWIGVSAPHRHRCALNSAGAVEIFAFSAATALVHQDTSDAVRVIGGGTEWGELGSTLSFGELDGESPGDPDLAIGTRLGNEAWLVAGPIPALTELCAYGATCTGPGPLHVTRFVGEGDVFGRTVELGDFGGACGHDLLTADNRITGGSGATPTTYAAYVIPGCDACRYSNVPPTPDPGGPYVITCANGGVESIDLDGSGSFDADGDTPLTYHWTIDPASPCVNATFTPNDSTSPLTTLTFELNESGCDRQCEVTLTVSDCGHQPGAACDAAVSCSTLVTVHDQDPPEILGVPADLVLECPDPIPPPAAVTATDDCPEPVNLNMETLIAFPPPGCPVISRFERRWTAIDACGRVTVESQFIETRDTTAPVLTGVPADVTAECGSVPPPPVVTALDACDGPLAVAFSEEVLGNCPKLVIRRWSAVDSCLNDVRGEQRITVQDTLAPVLSGVPADATVDCSSIPPVPAVTALDACDGSVPVAFRQFRVLGPCPVMFVLTRQWSATDSCGNVVTATQVLQLVDTTPPVMTNLPPATLTIQCPAVPPSYDVQVSDACDPNPVMTLDQVRVNGPCSGTYTLTRTWTATDRCLNVSTFVQTVSVVDTTPPLLFTPPDMSVECPPPPPALPTAVDACMNALVPATYLGETRVDGSCPNRYTLTRRWTATDCSGNVANGVQVIQVDDTTAPVISGTFVECVWPVNNQVHCITPLISDACDAVTDLELFDVLVTTNQANPPVILTVNGSEICLVLDRDRSNPVPRTVDVFARVRDRCGNESPSAHLAHFILPRNPNDCP